MPDRILIDALQATPEAAGVARYALEAARAMVALRDDVVVVVRDEMKKEFDLPSDRLISVRSLGRSWRRIAFEQLRLPSIAKPFQLVHFPDSACSLLNRSNYLMTVHDLSFFARPGTFTAMQSAWKKMAARVSGRHAHIVVCSSRHTANDVKKWLDVPEERIEVIYPGITTSKEEARPPDTSCPDGNFVLGVGTLEPRKNFVRLFEAVALLRKQGLRMHVVIAGKPGWMYEEILRAPEKLGIRDSVTFVGFCSDSQLKWLYQRAAMLSYVSLYEGFGFPPLEAMSFGLPVIAANVSSIPEVCGEAALLVDPGATEQLAAAIRKLHEDTNLRGKLIESGRERVKMFSWDNTAAKISDIYDKALGHV